MIRISVALLLSLACFAVPEAAAQEQRGFFIEPRIQTTRVLGETIMFIGGRAGVEFASGIAVDGGLDVLSGTAYRDPGPYFGNTIRGLYRLSFAFRHHGLLGSRVRYDVGLAGAVGTYDGRFCDGTDSCSGGEGYVGIIPEVGVRVAVLNWLSVRLSVGIDLHSFHGGKTMEGVALGAGVRFSP